MSALNSFGFSVIANGQLDPWSLVTQASAVVQIVMGVLVFMSLACWFIVGAKAIEFIAAKKANRRFSNFFLAEGKSDWDADRLQSIYAGLVGFQKSPIASVFRAGYGELARVLNNSNDPTSDDVENVKRALERAESAQVLNLESFLPMLATTAAVAPFIGLFGTVWGIMDAFIAIHGEKDASLDVVAPGIAEALFATAIGLVAAIPAVMAYNYFVRRLRKTEAELDSFAKDFLNIVQRHFLRR